MNSPDYFAAECARMRYDAAMAKMRASFRQQAANHQRERSLNEINAEELVLYDRAEARAINNGFS